MREKKKFGKRTDIQRKLPNDTTIKETFGIVQILPVILKIDGKQIDDFIEKTTGHKINIGDKNECF